MKKVICLILAAFVALSMAACAPKATAGTSSAATKATAASTTAAKDTTASTGSTSGAKEAKKIKIGWAPPDITGVFKTATDYMEKAVADAKGHGIEIELITRAATSHTSAADQVKTIENFIQNKVDVMIVSPTEVEAIKPALKEANDAGIPIILVNMLDGIDGIKIAQSIGFDNAQAASVCAYSMLDALGGPGVLGEGEKATVKAGDKLDIKWWEALYKDVDVNSISGKVGMIEGIAGDYFSNERVKGFKAVTDKFPGIKIVSSLAADWNRQKALKAAENILQGNKELDVIFASSNEMGMGAASAVKNANRDVMVITEDGTPESLDLIRSGGLTAETWHGFPEWGWYGVKFGTMLALGEEVPATFDTQPRTEYKDNADDFYPNPKLDTINWDEIYSNAK